MFFWLISFRQEVFELRSSTHGAIGDMSQHCETHLKPETEIQRAALPDVGAPRHVLFMRQTLFGFRDGPAADSVQH